MPRLSILSAWNLGQCLLTLSSLRYPKHLSISFVLKGRPISPNDQVGLLLRYILTILFFEAGIAGAIVGFKYMKNVVYRFENLYFSNLKFVICVCTGGTHLSHYFYLEIHRCSACTGETCIIIMSGKHRGYSNNLGPPIAIRKHIAVVVNTS